MPIISISINLSLAQNLNLLAGNFLLMTKYRYRKNIINESHTILLPGNKGNTAIKNTLYGVYNINKILPPGKYYRRKP